MVGSSAGRLVHSLGTQRVLSVQECVRLMREMVCMGRLRAAAACGRRAALIQDTAVCISDCVATGCLCHHSSNRCWTLSPIHWSVLSMQASLESVAYAMLPGKDQFIGYHISLVHPPSLCLLVCFYCICTCSMHGLGCPGCFARWGNASKGVLSARQAL